MATAEKGSLLKNVKIKIKDKEEKEISKEPSFNISGDIPNDQENIKLNDKDSSKLSQDNKEVQKENFDLSEKEENLNSKIIKENSKEANILKEISSKEEEKSENKSDYNYKNTNEKEGQNNLDGSQSQSDNNNSSFLNSNHYNNLNNRDENYENEENEYNDEDNCNFINRNKPFMTTGKFMQIQPHFGIFTQQIDELHNGIYENTKKCLIYKSSLQQSENLIREKSNSVVRDMVDKIFNLRQMFANANKNISMTISEVKHNVMRIEQIQAKTRKDINDCDHKINDCERQIGYKLLGKPNYSFMKRCCNTTTK